MKPDGRKVFYLDAIDVMPDYQGKGYGTGLISFARDYAKTIDCYKMYLITNKVIFLLVNVMKQEE